MSGTTRLAEWRQNTDYTLADMSGLTGLSPAFLSRLERGLRSARPETKVAIARRLGVTVSDLFEVEPLQEIGA